MTEECSKNKSMFRDINADDDDPEVTEIESLCMNCEEKVRTWALIGLCNFSDNTWILSTLLTAFTIETVHLHLIMCGRHVQLGFINVALFKHDFQYT